MDYRGKQVLVLGLGESGLAMARWLARCGAGLVVADTRLSPERLPMLQQMVPAARFVGANFSADLLVGIDFIAVSPGLSPQELSTIVPVAEQENIPIWGEIELFAQALHSLRTEHEYVPKVIAITGTNGKTTVTSLVGLLCKRSGMNVRVAGNISPAALDVLREVLDQNDLPQVWVLELSSFQLRTTFSLQADAATVLNITGDHLDWHGDLASYVADKVRIFGPTTTRVLNRDDDLVMQMMPPFVSVGKNAVNVLSAPVTTFGSDLPKQPDCFGLCNEAGMEWLVFAAAEEEERRGRKGELVEIAVTLQRLMPTDALKIHGRHNALNALAALAICRAINLPLAPLLHGLRDYQGEPHRVELIATVGGVNYYDDSKGTNVGATVAALNGLAAGIEAKRRLILIAGGEGKGQDFSPLVQPISNYVRAIFLIGKDAPQIATALIHSNVECMMCQTMEEAVNGAAAVAEPGDLVLLSPACASFDMFRNYVHRAEVFIDAVREHALSRGEVMV